MFYVALYFASTLFALELHASRLELLGRKMKPDTQMPLHVQSESHSKNYSLPDRPVLIDHFWISKEGVKYFDGGNFLLFQTFQEKSGIRFDFKTPTPLNYGSARNGTYDGEIGQVQNGVVDMSYSLITHLQDRLNFADYTVPLCKAPLNIVVRRAPFIPFWKVLLIPFSLKMWLIILFSFFVVALTWAVVYRRQVSYNIWECYSNIFQLESALFDVAQLVLTGGCVKRTRVFRQRVCLGAALLVVLVLSSAYQGMLLGFLAARSRYPEPQTLQEAMPFVKNIYTYSFLTSILERDDVSPVLKTVRQKMILVGMDDLISNVGIYLRENNAMMMSEVQFSVLCHLKMFADNDEIVFHLIPERLNNPGYGCIMISKTSPLKKRFSNHVMYVVQSGLYNHWQAAQRYRMTANGLLLPETKGRSSRDPNALGLNQMTGAFLALAWGLSVATVVFILELVTKHFHYTGSRRLLPLRVTEFSNAPSLER